jgi:diaminohydroxyphosphoribosylaminopyrimidine deaminase/5-amino-6-(5-phosphoribosylamino)uracil reductase
VETNTRLTVSGGTRAPQLPSDAEVVAQHDYDGNVIISYRNRLVPRPISESPI